MTDSFDFDLFISHASEDKDGFVRPLVDGLAGAGLTVWFDEASLHAGDSLIQSVEIGLSRSRFGLVVLSPDFFAKRWPRAELDALTHRELTTGDRVLIPIWLGVDADEVREYSPLLADRYAIIGIRGTEYVVSAVANRIRPGGSPLAIARELLADRGIATPPPSDPWWLDVVESATEPDYIDIHSGLFRWGFPLPPDEGDASSRGSRLAQAAMRDAWISEADRRPITQLTEPGIVHEFIDEMPGLMETCLDNPRYLGSYAPQLLIPGFGGPFETLFDDWLSDEQATSRSLDTVAWHLSDYSSCRPESLTCDFVQGELMGPTVKFYDEHIDHFFWALSDTSEWLPPAARDVLTRGFCAWRAWVPDGPNELSLHEALVGKDESGIEDEPDLGAIRRLLTLEAEKSAAVVGLPDDPEVLADRLLDTGAVDAYRGLWRRSMQNGSGDSDTV